LKESSNSGQDQEEETEDEYKRAIAESKKLAPKDNFDDDLAKAIAASMSSSEGNVCE